MNNLYLLCHFDNVIITAFLHKCSLHNKLYTTSFGIMSFVQQIHK